MATANRETVREFEEDVRPIIRREWIENEASDLTLTAKDLDDKTDYSCVVIGRYLIQQPWIILTHGGGGQNRYKILPEVFDDDDRWEECDDAQGE